MKNKIKIILFDELYTFELEEMLEEFSIEIYNKGTCDVYDFIKSHHAIYLAMCGEKVIGFSSYQIIDVFGMSEPYITNDFLYIDKRYRNTKATYLFLLQTGKIIENNDMPLVHYYASIGSEKLSRKLDGKKLYTAYRYDREEVLREFSRLKKKIPIKG